jgi:hypothetical protein
MHNYCYITHCRIDIICFTFMIHISIQKSKMCVFVVSLLFLWCWKFYKCLEAAPAPSRTRSQTLTVVLPAAISTGKMMINYVPPRNPQAFNHSFITPWHPESSRARLSRLSRPDHLEALVTIVARPSGSHAILWSYESFVSSFVASFAWNWHPWNSSFRWTRCCHHLKTWDEKGRERTRNGQDPSDELNQRL